MSFVTFQTRPGSTYFASMIILSGMLGSISKWYRDVLHINILDEFHVNISVTFVIFQTGSLSAYLVSTITLKGIFRLF